MGALRDQCEEAGVILLDDDHLGEPHRLDALLEILAVLRQPPQEQKDVERAFDAARVGLQPDAEDRLTARVGQGSRGHVVHVVVDVRGGDGRQGEGDLDDLLQIARALDLRFVVGVAGADTLLDEVAVQPQDEDETRDV